SRRSALLIFSAMAVDTLAAAINCVHRHSIAGCHPAHVCPNFHDIAGKLMPDDERDGSPGAWVRFLRNVQRAVQVFIEVRMAQSRAFHPQAYVVASEVRLFGEILEANVLRSVVDECLHLSPIPSRPGLMAPARQHSTLSPKKRQQDVEFRSGNKYPCTDRNRWKSPSPSQSNRSVSGAAPAAPLGNAQAVLHRWPWPRNQAFRNPSWPTSRLSGFSFLIFR